MALDEHPIIPDAPPGDAGETLRSDRMPFVHWLMTRHHKDDPLWPLAHLVLSGGPDAVWERRFDLSATIIADDLRVYFAAGNHAVTEEHLNLAKQAIAEYRSSEPQVADLIIDRRRKGLYETTGYVPEGASYSSAGKIVTAAMREAYTERGMRTDQHSAYVPQVTDDKGEDTHDSTYPLPVLKIDPSCAYVSERTGRRCKHRAVVGNETCTMHGARLYTDEELKGIHRATKEKLLAAGEQAVDNLIELLSSTNDMVRLKASEAILDRTGFTPGMEVTVINTTLGDRTPSQIIAERLDTLADHLPVNIVEGELVDPTEPPQDEPPEHTPTGNDPVEPIITKPSRPTKSKAVYPTSVKNDKSDKSDKNESSS